MTRDRDAALPIDRSSWLPLFIAICLVAANLRITLTGIGPVLDQIAADQGVPVSALGALGSIPLLTWAACSPLAHAVSERFGLERPVTWSLVVLALGTIWRSAPGPAVNLWLGTALIGVGLAIVNVLLPAIIKNSFPARLPLIMGIYTALLGGAGSIGAGIVVPLSHIETAHGQLGWRVALITTGALIPVALLVWLFTTHRRRSQPVSAEAETDPSAQPETGTAGAGRRIWGDGLAWLVAGYMGAQSFTFYATLTWLAPYLQSLGQSPAAAGLSTMIYQMIGIGGSMLVPLLMRGALRRRLTTILPLTSLVVFIGMLILPALMPLWITVGGLTAGAHLTMSITLMAMRARTHTAATALSGMAQSVGYLIAALGPLLFGALFGFSGGWLLPFVLLWVVTAAHTMIGFAVRHPRFVLEPR